MITLTLAFWILVILFGVIGAMRGWAKELLVSFSVIVALFIITIMTSFGPLKNFYAQLKGASAFWVPSLVLIILVCAGYQTPALAARFSAGKFARDKLSDILLGFFIGMLNGYLIFGSLWYFMAQAGYPFSGITAPPAPPPIIVNYLPPEILEGPILYAAVGLAFLFVLLVFI